VGGTPATPEDKPSFLRKYWNAIWSVQEATTETDSISDVQPEVDIGDHSLFTRQTSPFNPRQVAEILKLVTVGPDLTTEQTEEVKALISKFADCFRLVSQ
jgi:hypothetical protein